MARQGTDGLFILERRIRTAASVWLFDDLPFARIDEAAAEALTITLRALLRRPAELTARPSARPRAVVPATETRRGSAEQSAGLSGDATLEKTILAVAQANGRVAAAARQLGVHRNTVLYRLRRASTELGVDPRRPEDALAILRRAEESAEST